MGHETYLTGTFQTVMDRSETYTTVATSLSASGITNNLNSVNNSNANSFAGLYFELANKGKIAFTSNMDLTDTGTQLFLQNLGNALIMQNGFINFILYSSSTASGSAMKSKPATLTMYLTTAQFANGAGSSNNIVAKDTDGTVLAGVVSNFFCTGSALPGIAQECSFDVSHFTSFGTKPTLPYVHIISSNSDANYAKVGDTITVNFTGSEDLTGVSVNIAGNSASVSGSGTDRTATYTTLIGDTDGTVSISINFQDMFGNSGSTVTSTTDTSSVIFDKTNPAITSITTGQYFNANITPAITEANYSGATVNGAAYTS